MGIVETIEMLCKKKGVSRRQMERDVGLSSGSTSKWKVGYKPNSASLMKIAAYFDVSYDSLLHNDPGDDEDVYRVPVLGRVAAGVPLFAAEEIIDWEELPKVWKRKGEYFGLQIKGNSMEPRMVEGDVVIVRQQDTCENGQIAIVMVNGDEATCKRVMFHDNGIALVSTNPIVPPMFYTCEEVERLPLKILGVVVELRAKMCL